MISIKETILLVEDEDAVRNIVLRVLNRAGYTVLTATNGQGALGLLQNQPETRIDLLITDMIMPQMGGSALAGQLKTIYPEAKVLFISGYIYDVGDEPALGTAGYSFLAKPFTPQLLIEKVQEILAKEV